MADNATPGTSQETTSGQVAVPGSTPTAGPQGQPASDIDYEKIDLFKVPAFTKKFQPQYQAALSQKQQAEQSAYLANQEVLRMREAMKQLERQQAPDDWERSQVELKQALQERDEARQYAAWVQQQQADMQRRQQEYEAVQAQIDADLDMLAAEFEVEKEEIRQGNPKDFKDAMARAKKLYANKLTKLKEVEKEVEAQAAEDREADRPDLGGGVPVPAISTLEKQYNAATNSLDKARIGRLMRAELKKKQK